MRIALGVEYCGTRYHGWQLQEQIPTLQRTLDQALSKIADEPIKTLCAGRTDAGVHALGQVVHFDTNTIRTVRAWSIGTNAFLPSDIAVRWAQEVDDNFHARFTAVARSYRYLIHNQSTRSAIMANRATWYHHELNAGTMQQAANFLIGENDFTSFRSSECESPTAMRNVHSIKVFRVGDYVIFDLKANAFLHHMVRNIAGVLMRIGAGFEEPEWMQQVLAAKDRRCAADTASPHGLYLERVYYPSSYSFPVDQSPWFI
jgi:tRNA pseudouridine38-40 synthase